MKGRDRLMLAVVILGLAARAAAQTLDVRKLEGLLGRPGTREGAEFKVSVPRDDLSVELDGWRLAPGMGLTSWLAFSPHGSGAMVMGDLVLLENEVKLVQRAAVDAGLDITAVHNHFLREKPKVMFMHVSSMGSLEEVGAAARKVLDAAEALRKSKARPVKAAAKAQDWGAVDLALGRVGKDAGGAHKLVIGRPDVALEDQGAGVDAFMGFNTWMAFAGTPEKAAVSGDFAMMGTEVAAVIRELVKHGIEVTAVHNHMVRESPRAFFLHFWGTGRAADLAQGLKAALDHTGARAAP